ncbi:zinc finger protein 431 [Aedes albopictus]|uniref:C2h2-type zn-finger protein n=1 Tax=Aedes albopictus TaxID=7160 RepID=A0ABM1YHR4_AEDAL
MTVFNLEHFPNVCRLCLKPESSEMFDITSEFERIRTTIETFLVEISFRPSEDKAEYLPKLVCGVCFKQLTDFALYRNRVVLTLRFMEALVDMKHSNSEPLTVLFQERKNELDILFRELSLCSKPEPQIEDILQDLETYNIPQCEIEINVKKEKLEADKSDDEDASYECPNDKEPNAKSEIYLCEEYPEQHFANESSSEDDKPLSKRKKAKTKAVSSSAEYTGPKRGRGRPRTHPDGTFLKERWSCDKCKFTTKYRLAVDRHKAVHEKRENRIYSCSSCDQVFKTYDAMRIHNLTHPENQVVCEVCGVSLKNVYSLQAHMERHDDERKYSCEYCDYTTQTRLSLKAHMNIHTNRILKMRCEVCGIAFRTASRLKRHMEGHSNERKYPCERCPARFNTTNALRNHRTRVHLAIRHPCDYCEKTFDQKIAMRDHVERIHNIQCNFICDVCVAVFDSQERLDFHKQRHDNPKPMECRLCLTLYSSQEDLDNHLCITYRDDYLCCNKDLRNHAQYNRHMLVKHGLKTNARVKPVPGMLLGQLRGARKRLEQCRKCDIAFPSRALKLQHMMECNQSAAT